VLGSPALASAALTFAPHADFATAGTNPPSVAIGDLNGDERPDLAVPNLNSDEVSVLLGTGSGSFETPTNFAAGARPFFVAIGDLNNDARPDLAAANFNSNDVSCCSTLPPRTPARWRSASVLWAHRCRRARSAARRV
jgi:hypothetical protein